MIGNFIIPVINTETGNFDYNGTLSRDVYEEMVSENFRRNNAKIQRLADSIENSTEFDFGERRKIVSNKDSDITLSSCEALFLNSKKKDYDSQKLEEFVKSGKMSIILVNINPNTLDEDAESDLRYWMADSQKILDDEELNDRAKIGALPKMSFGIKINDNDEYWLNNCKMFENYSGGKYPFYFALIIEKIIKK